MPQYLYDLRIKFQNLHYQPDSPFSRPTISDDERIIVTAKNRRQADKGAKDEARNWTDVEKITFVGRIRRER